MGLLGSNYSRDHTESLPVKLSSGEAYYMTMSPLNDTAVEVAALLLSAADVAGRASVVAAAIVEQLADCACAVHRLDHHDDNAVWTAIGVAGDISIEQVSMSAVSRVIAPLLVEPDRALIYAGSAIRREDYSHVRVSRSIASLAYIPLSNGAGLTGAIEILSFSAPLRQQDLDDISPIVRLASPAIVAADEFEQQRQTLLDSVHRMSQLYDLEKSLNSTLELDAVIAMIPVKALAMLECQAIHLWLFDGEVLRLMSSHGEDATVEVGMTQAPGEGYVADIAEEGEPVLIDESDDPRLAQRNASIDEDSRIAPVTNALVVPLLQGSAEVGVIEAINGKEHPLDDDDMFFLVSMAETISSALKNASLLHAERKLEILKALVHVSSEITSTLRLDRLLQIIVNSPQNVLPYERCAVALDNRGRLQLKAVSGMSNLPLGDAQVDRMNELMRWLSTQAETLHLRRAEDSDAKARASLPAEIAHYFDESGVRGLYALPLTDDQGRVGLLLYESSNPDFLEEPHIEMIKVLAGQATVAIRNAQLYREVPLISLIEPLLHKKHALMSSSRKRRMTYAAVAFEVVLFLVFCPLPMRVSGDAIVAPQHMVSIAAPVDGNVMAVYAHEGQRVAAGEVLGALNDWEWRTNLAAEEAKYHEALLVMENDLARGSAQAGADRAQVEFLRSEVARAQSRLDSAQLRSPIAGIVITPNLQNAAGKHLVAGDTFAQVLDLSQAVLQVAVAEGDAILLRPDQAAAVKLDSYPQRTWHDPVAVISPEARLNGDKRIFTAEIPVANTDATLRAGMTGRAKIFIGWRPAGYVLLRRPALWIWQTMWNWIGW
jgi:transcriptional regulator with GAF, ATPase, and Fis domain